MAIISEKALKTGLIVAFHESGQVSFETEDEEFALLPEEIDEVIAALRAERTP